MKQKFIQAIHDKQMIRLSFYSKEDERVLTRLCAPMDYGIKSKVKNSNDYFHFWNYESDKGAHTLSILPEQVRNMEFLNLSFKPSEFVTWQTKWIVARDWGGFS